MIQRRRLQLVGQERTCFSAKADFWPSSTSLRFTGPGSQPTTPPDPRKGKALRMPGIQGRLRARSSLGPAPPVARVRACAAPRSVPCVRVPAEPAGRWFPECPGRGLRNGHRAGAASSKQSRRRALPEATRTASGEWGDRERADGRLRACAASDRRARGALPAAGRRGRAWLGRDGAAGRRRDRGWGGARIPRPGSRGAGRAGGVPEELQAGRCWPRAEVLASGPEGRASCSWGRRGGARRTPRGSCRQYGRSLSARPPKVAEVQGGGAAEQPRRRAGGGAAPLSRGGAGWKREQSSLEQLYWGAAYGARPTPRPSPSPCGRRTPANAGGLLRVQFPSGPGARPPSSELYSLPIRS